MALKQREISKLAVLAGSGGLPHYILEYTKHAGIQTIAVLFKGQSYERSFDHVEHQQFDFGQIKKISSYLLKHGVTHVVMAGAIKRPSISNLNLDIMGARWLIKCGGVLLGDDNLLTKIINIAEQELNVTFIGAHEILPEKSNFTEGYFGKYRANKTDLEDIKRGLDVFKHIGQTDVGQSLVVSDGLVLAIEAIEGTDSMLMRAGQLRPTSKGGVLLKMMKHHQEKRADLPTIGPQTANILAQQKLNGMVIDARSMLILDKHKLIELCDRRGIFIYAHNPDNTLKL
ncbi:MAG: UDP-2,3-diacylglucosamine diphosphatase LpxI [Pseudomonadota bacterium]